MPTPLSILPAKSYSPPEIRIPCSRGTALEEQDSDIAEVYLKSVLRFPDKYAKKIVQGLYPSIESVSPPKSPAGSPIHHAESLYEEHLNTLEEELTSFEETLKKVKDVGVETLRPLLDTFAALAFQKKTIETRFFLPCHEYDDPQAERRASIDALYPKVQRQLIFLLFLTIINNNTSDLNADCQALAEKVVELKDNTSLTPEERRAQAQALRVLYTSCKQKNAKLKSLCKRYTVHSEAVEKRELTLCICHTRLLSLEDSPPSARCTEASRAFLPRRLTTIAESKTKKKEAPAIAELSSIQTRLLHMQILLEKIALLSHIDMEEPIKESLRVCIKTLPLLLQNTIFGRVYELSCNPAKGGDNWGEIHMLDDLSTLKNAMELSLRDLPAFAATYEQGEDFRRALQQKIHSEACDRKDASPQMAVVALSSLLSVIHNRFEADMHTRLHRYIQVLKEPSKAYFTNKLFEEIYLLSPEPKGGDSWGELHACDNLFITKVAIERCITYFEVQAIFCYMP